MRSIGAELPSEIESGQRGGGGAGHVPQSAGHQSQLSPENALHTPSPQFGGSMQSSGQLNRDSPTSHVPSPHDGSAGTVCTGGGGSGWAS